MLCDRGNLAELPRFECLCLLSTLVRKLKLVCKGKLVGRVPTGAWVEAARLLTQIRDFCSAPLARLGRGFCPRDE